MAGMNWHQSLERWIIWVDNTPIVLAHCAEAFFEVASDAFENDRQLLDVGHRSWPYQFLLQNLEKHAFSLKKTTSFSKWRQISSTLLNFVIRKVALKVEAHYETNKWK